MTNCRPDIRRVLYHGGHVNSVDLALPHLLVAGGRDHFNTSGIISVWSLEGDTKSERVATLTPERVEGCAENVDAVLSVATTTIHGAGMLQKPTLCLRSRNSDWRWIAKLERSYWYASVEATSQAPDGDWMGCLDQASTWLRGLERTDTPANVQPTPELRDAVSSAMQF